MAKLVNAAETTAYVKYYRNLENTYPDIKACNDSLQENFKNKFMTKIHEAAREDSDSRLGTYLEINPLLSKPEYSEKHEFQRIIITRYRTGSHNLRIEKDRRLPNVPREDRLCVCNTGVQSIRHVLQDCPMLNEIRENPETQIPRLCWRPLLLFRFSWTIVKLDYRHTVSASEPYPNHCFHMTNF